MRVNESDAIKKLTYLFNEGRRMDWLGVAGDSVSRWLTPPEIMAMEAELSWEGNFHPLQIKEPRLAKVCFMYCSHGDGMSCAPDGGAPISVLIFQVNAAGDRYRILWENGQNSYSPLELAIHFTAHAAHSVGPGCVVFHCQPLKTVALAAIIGNDEERFLNELLRGYAAIQNMLPDGVGMLPWQMPRPLRREAVMTEEQFGDLRAFTAQIREHIRHQESLVLLGEGILCASRSERAVHSIIHAIERAATIRLEMLRAGV